MNGALVLLFGWIFVNPLLVLFLSNYWTVNGGLDYKIVQIRLSVVTGTLGVVAFLSAGTIAYSRTNVADGY